MAINLVTKFIPYVDEIFTTESKKELVTNNDFDWTGAHVVKIHKVNSVAMCDYDRAGTTVGKANSSTDSTIKWSRYGALQSVENTIEEMTLSKDRSFTFAIDTLDTDETGMVLNGAEALGRQQREVIIPEVDTYVFGKMCTGAGTKVTDTTLSNTNIYTEIIKGSNALDNAEVPETSRVLLVTPDTYLLMKQCDDITMETDIGNDMRIKGVIGNLDGMPVIKVPKARLPQKFGFMIAHPCATVAPVKLAEYRVHANPPGISGQLVEGRIAYDAFVLDNKNKAIYYAENKPATQG